MNGGLCSHYSLMDSSLRSLDSKHLTLMLVSAASGPFADCVDQDQTAQNVQSHLRSALSATEICSPKVYL